MRFPEVGENFAGKYRVEAMLGSGGFSRVYKATQLDLGRDVAIKILQPPIHPSTVGDERDDKLQALMTRFEREARMISQLRTASTITMYDYGRTEDGQLYMSLEYVDGLTLTDLIERDGALDPERVVTIMRQVLMSLYEAHEQGMLHRDIKPQNIMVFDHIGQRDQVKLLDFGIVKLVSRETTREMADLTSDDTLVGTPRYMAPEYIRGDEISAAADIYALGLVMYELLVGKQAIRANSSIQIIGKQLERESFYLPQSLEHVDLPLRHIINGMVEKSTALRYETINQILRDLDKRAQHLPIEPRVPTAPIPAADLQFDEEVFEEVEVEPIYQTGPIDTEEIESSLGSRPKLAIAIALLGVLFVVGASLVAIPLLHDGGTSAPDAEVVAKTEHVIKITTDPPEAALTINGRAIGSSPLEFDASDVSFPAIVEATHDGRVQTQTLEQPGDVTLTLPEADDAPDGEDPSDDETLLANTESDPSPDTRDDEDPKETRPAEAPADDEKPARDKKRARKKVRPPPPRRKTRPRVEPQPEPKVEAKPEPKPEPDDPYKMVID